MKVADTFTNQGVTVELRASMIDQDLYFFWSEKFAEMDKTELERFDTFLYITSCVQSVDGLDWTIPTRQSDEDAMRESYVQFWTQVNMEFVAGIQAKINELQSPSANAVQKPDETLTEDEKKTSD